MSRTTSIAGVRPLGWLARVRAQCSRLAWACPAQLLAAGALGWRQSRHWAWERAMIMRISARSQAEGRADGKRCTRKLRTGRGSESARSAHKSRRRARLVRRLGEAQEP